jgi:hypothetical protein
MGSYRPVKVRWMGMYTPRLAAVSPTVAAA